MRCWTSATSPWSTTTRSRPAQRWTATAAAPQSSPTRIHSTAAGTKESLCRTYYGERKKEERKESDSLNNSCTSSSSPHPVAVAVAFLTLLTLKLLSRSSIMQGATPRRRGARIQGGPQELHQRRQQTGQPDAGPRRPGAKVVQALRRRGRRAAAHRRLRHLNVVLVLLRQSHASPAARALVGSVL